MPGWQKLWQGSGLVILTYGVLILIGAASGSSDPLQPLNKLSFSQDTAMASTQELTFKHIKGLDELNKEIAAANAQGKSVMVDFYADWCVSCKEMEKYTFSDASNVQGSLSQTVLLKADVTENDDMDKVLMKNFGIFGPPAILFFDTQGQERKQYRVVGFMKAEAFNSHIKQNRHLSMIILTRVFRICEAPRFMAGSSHLYSFYLQIKLNQYLYTLSWIQLLRKGISTMLKLYKLRKVSVFVLIAVFLGAGIMPIMNGFQIKISDNKSIISGPDIAIKVAQAKLHERDKIDYSIVDSTDINNEKGETLFYVYSLRPQGYIVVAGSYDLPPIIAYSFTSNFSVYDDTNPLYSMLCSDITLRLENIQKLPEQIIQERHFQWNSYVKENPFISDGFEQWPPEGTTSTGG